MSTWIENYEGNPVGTVGFLVEKQREARGNPSTFVLQDRPPYTNQSHEPRLHGWCGTYNNVAKYGRGMARIVRCAGNGRALVKRLDGIELTVALHDAGFPELDPSDETIAQRLAKLSAADAGRRADALCPESERDQDWDAGSTSYEFSDGSVLSICDTEVEAH